MEDEYKIMTTDQSITPPEIMCTSAFISQEDEEIDDILPNNCKTPGTILYTDDFSVIKIRKFDGSWEVLTE